MERLNEHSITDDEDFDELMLVINGIPRTIYERANYFESLDQSTFYRRFRISKDIAVQILRMIEVELEQPLDLNNSISPINQLLIFLRLCATGTHLSCIADFSGAHVSTISRIVKRVGRAIARRGRNYIKMPERSEFNEFQLKFFEIGRFPRVIGAVDGTHIKVQSPGGEDAEIFRNRKGYFSLNVQIVCSADLKILDLVARWPGSTHDCTIFNNSRLMARFEGNCFPSCFLLGDSGYYLKPYLLTPILNPSTDGERRYNASHIKTRNSVERTIGVWKRRFPILAYGCRLKLETVLEVIVATAVLHNICRSYSAADPPEPEDLQSFARSLDESQVPSMSANDQNNRNIGAQMRNSIIQTYFSNISSSDIHLRQT